MNCEEFENRILNHPNQPLTPADWAMVESHAAGCAACQVLTRRFEKLDAALTREITAPDLSAEFNQRLYQCIQYEVKVFSEAQRAERKRQLQAEFEAGLAHLARQALTVSGLLDMLGYALLGGLAGLFVWQFVSPAPNPLGGAVAVGLREGLLLPTFAGAVFLCVGLAAAFRRQFRALWLAA